MKRELDLDRGHYTGREQEHQRHNGHWSDELRQSSSQTSASDHDERNAGDEETSRDLNNHFPLTNAFVAERSGTRGERMLRVPLAGALAKSQRRRSRFRCMDTHLLEVPYMPTVGEGRPSRDRVERTDCIKISIGIKCGCFRTLKL